MASQNHRMTWVERILKIIQFQLSAMKRDTFHYITLPKYPLNLILKYFSIVMSKSSNTLFHTYSASRCYFNSLGATSISLKILTLHSLTKRCLDMSNTALNTLRNKHQGDRRGNGQHQKEDKMK